MKIEIRNKKDLEAFRDKLDDGTIDTKDLEVLLLADIDFLGDSWSWKRGGVFSGVFDGCGHTVKNIKIETCRNGFYESDVYKLNLGYDFYIDRSVGFFLYQDGVIKNLNLECEICEPWLRHEFDKMYIENETLGGICAVNCGDIINCTVSGRIMSSKICGGICGHNNGRIIDCENRAEIETEFFSFYTVKINNFQLDQIAGLHLDYEEKALDCIGPDPRIINCKQNGSMYFSNKNSIIEQYVLLYRELWGYFKEELFDQMLIHDKNPSQLNAMGQNMLHFFCDLYRRINLDSKQNKQFALKMKITGVYPSYTYWEKPKIPLLHIARSISKYTDLDFSTKDRTGKTALDYVKLAKHQDREEHALIIAFIREKLKQQKEDQAEKSDTNFSTIGF